MYMSFYVGAIGADACMEKLSVVSNNLANVNNRGFRPKTSSFQELINYNINDSREPVTELQAGASIKVQKTTTNFRMEPVTETESPLDFSIMQNNAFFMVQDPATDEITYTRDGHFHRADQGDGTFLLATDSGKLVLDENQEPIQVDGENADALVTKPGVYTFTNPSRLVNVGDNEYAVQNEEMDAVLVEDATLWSRALESSGTDVAKEFTKLIECQRAYAYALRMVTVSDEIEGTYNSLRG